MSWLRPTRSMRFRPMRRSRSRSTRHHAPLVTMRFCAISPKRRRCCHCSFRPRRLRPAWVNAFCRRAEAVASMAPAAKIVPLRAWLPFALAAAVLAVLAVGLAGWGLSERTALNSARQYQQRQAALLALLQSAGPVLQTPATDSVPSGILIEPKGGEGPAFFLTSWPSPPPGRTYQAWYIAGGRPVSAGVFGGSPNGLQVVQLAPLDQAAQAFAVTLEPAGGSTQPTTEPLFVRPLASS
jgi:hypothetical protein